MEEEIWKKIDNFPNYSVSNLGKARNDITARMMKQCLKGGYYHCGFTNNSTRKSCKVHRIVALAFIPNPENKSDVNHKDKNKINNNISNLEWNTRKENNIHRCIDLEWNTRKENNIHRCIDLNCSNNKNKRVLRIEKKTNEIVEKYNSIEDAGIWACSSYFTQNSHNGRNSIGNCINGLSKTAYGYVWKYEDSYENLDGEIWKQVVIENVESDKNYFVSN